MIFVRELLRKNVMMVSRTRALMRKYSALPPSIPRSQSSTHDDNEPSSLSSFIFENLHNNSSWPALVNREEELSFMEVRQLDPREPELPHFFSIQTWGSAVRFGGGLLEHGIKPGAVLATVSPNTSHLVTATLGATEVGLGVATLCPSSQPGG